MGTGFQEAKTDPQGNLRDRADVAGGRGLPGDVHA